MSKTCRKLWRRTRGSGVTSNGLEEACWRTWLMAITSMANSASSKGLFWPSYRFVSRRGIIHLSASQLTLTLNSRRTKPS
jgi:hypothetical protein